MTQAQTANPREREKEDPVFGVSDETLADLEGLTIDTADLTEGGLAEVDVMILGFSTQKGGETRTRKNRDTGEEETYETGDSMHIHQRVLNPEEVGLEDPNIIQYLTLPKAIPGPDGRMRRVKATKSSAYGMWLISLAGQGVSSNVQEASVFQWSNVNDLVGLKFHRVRMQFPTYNGGEMRVDCPMEIYGFDNEYRAERGMEPHYIKGQEPAAGRTKAATAAG